MAEYPGGPSIRCVTGRIEWGLFVRGCAAGMCGWAGWSALPMLFWTVSGLVMVAKPIEEVRGDRPDRPPKPIGVAGPLVAPQDRGPAGRRNHAQAARRRAALGNRFRRRRRHGWPIRRPGRLLPRLGAADAAQGTDGALYRHRKVGRNQPGRRRQPAARTPPGDERLARPDERRHAFLRRWRFGRDHCATHPLVAVLRFHVGPAHHGPAGPRGHQQPVDRELRRPVAGHGDAGAHAAADDHPPQERPNGNGNGNGNGTASAPAKPARQPTAIVLVSRGAAATGGHSRQRT